LGIEIGIRTWPALMIAMRADAMIGGYWDCHDLSSVLSLETCTAEKKSYRSPPCLGSGKKGDQSSEVN
jgi:hypothetical protein